MQSIKFHLEQASNALLHHPKNHVEPGFRQAIYIALGPILEQGMFAPPSEDTSGTLRRLYLNLLTVRKVLPIWERIKANANWPHDNLPASLLSTAESIIHRAVSQDIAGNLVEATWEEFSLNRYSSYLRHNIAPDEASRAFAVEMGAYRVLAGAMGDFEFDPSTVNLALEEWDLDPWSWDAAHHASVAYAGIVWDATVDIQKNYSFWTWWLDEAVPTAYSMVPEPSTS
jgi:hypothetical protein